MVRTPLAMLVLTLALSAGAQNYSPPVAVNSSAAGGGPSETGPDIATDGAGVWIVPFQSDDSLGGTIGSDFDLFTSRSLDAGASWSTMAVLNDNASTDSGNDLAPSIETDGTTWIIAWDSSDDLGATIGSDGDILYVRSTDAGISWSSPTALNTNAATDSGTDNGVEIVVDGGGTWLAVWASDDDLGATVGSDLDILYARSVDAGATWSAPAVLNTNAATDSGVDNVASVNTDGSVWLAAWRSRGVFGADDDVLYARSTTGGTSWSAPAALNTDAATDSGNDFRPHVAPDGTGRWVAAWHSSGDLGGGVGSDFDIHTARSLDAGVSWSAPASLNADATDGFDGGDFDVRLLFAKGQWWAVWNGFDIIQFTPTLITTDFGLFGARSTDGVAWINETSINFADDPAFGDEFGAAFAESSGQLVTVWWSDDDLGGSIGTDRDVLASSASLNTVPIGFRWSLSFGLALALLGGAALWNASRRDAYG